jgi:hypothetical protein
MNLKHYFSSNHINALLRILSVAFAFVLLSILLLINGSSMFEGHDGALYLSTIQNLRLWGEVGSLSTLTPLSSMSARLLPINVWLDPGIVLASLSANLGEFQMLTIYMVHSILFFATCLLLLRILKLNWGAAITIAFIATAAMLTPLNARVGVYPLVNLNSNILLVASGYLVATAGVLLISKSLFTKWRMIIGSALCFGGVIYSILIEPLWGAIYLLFFSATFAMIAGLILLRFRSNAWPPVFTLLAVLIALWLSGTFEYVVTTIRYTARLVFPHEIYGAIQDYPNSGMPFRDTKSAILYAFLIFGQIGGIWKGHGLIRLLAITCLTALLFLAVLVLVYIYVIPNWPYPMPAYFEFAGTPLFLLSAILGWNLVVSAGFRAIMPKATAWITDHPSVCWAITALVLLGMTANVWTSGQKHLEISRATRDEVLSRFLGRNVIIDQLESEIALRPGLPFRGNVATVIGVSSGGLAGFANRDPNAPFDIYGASQMYNALFLLTGNEHRRMSYWFRGIPTLDEYGQLITPQFYYLCSRLLSRPVDFQSRNVIDITRFNASVMQVLGVRFVISDAVLSHPAVIRNSLKIEGMPNQLNLYELPNPNIGNYSPTIISAASSPTEAISTMESPSFDFQHQAILFEPLNEPLVPATDATLIWERGGIRVKARSRGHSLIVLPVQFSNSWQVKEVTNARLLRVNIAQLGLLFSGDLDIAIDFQDGFFNKKGRKQDLIEAKNIFRLKEQIIKMPDFVSPHRLN